MNILALETGIRAPAERIFDLARSVDLHVHSAAQTGEKAVGGVTHGLLAFGDEVTWRGRHFGVTQTLTAKITAFMAPEYFCDAMLRGSFQKFEHHHSFTAQGDMTVMREVLYYLPPFGGIGQIFDSVLLRAHLERFFGERSAVIKRVAEGDEWRRFLPPV